MGTYYNNNNSKNLEFSYKNTFKIENIPQYQMAPFKDIFSNNKNEKLFKFEINEFLHNNIIIPILIKLKIINIMK